VARNILLVNNIFLATSVHWCVPVLMIPKG